MALSKTTYLIHLCASCFCVLLFSSCNKSSELSRGEENRLHVFNEIAYFSRPTADGGFIVLSSQLTIKSIDANEKNITTYLSKINSNGEKSWTINFESYKTGYNYFFPKTVNAIRGGGFIVIAQFGIADPFSKHILLLKTDASGNIYSTKEISSNGSWEGPYFDIVQTSDANFALADGKKIYKLNSAGNLLWLYTNNFLYESYLMSLQDGGIIITSNEHGPVFSSRLKLNSIGDLMWQKFEDANNRVWRQTSISSLNNSDFVVAGSNTSASNLDFYLETFSPPGDSKTFIQIPGNLNEYCHAVLHTSDGGFLLIGTITQANDPDNGILFDDEVFPDFNARMIAVKLDSEMKIKWTKTYSSNYGSKGLCVNEAPGGNFLLLGNQVSFSNPNVVNMIVLKINSDGSIN